jgi:hypothetical protein
MSATYLFEFKNEIEKNAGPGFFGMVGGLARRIMPKAAQKIAPKVEGSLAKGVAQESVQYGRRPLVRGAGGTARPAAVPRPAPAPAENATQYGRRPQPAAVAPQHGATPATPQVGPAATPQAGPAAVPIDGKQKPTFMQNLKKGTKMAATGLAMAGGMGLAGVGYGAATTPSSMPQPYEQ